MVCSYLVSIIVGNLRQVLMLEKEVLLVTSISLQIQSYMEALSNTTCKILHIIFILLTPQYTKLVLPSTSGMKGLPDTVNFPITKLYLMFILVHPTTSWTDICMSFVTWHLIFFVVMHFLFPFHHHLHTSAHVLFAQGNKTPVINGWTLGTGVGWWDSEM